MELQISQTLPSPVETIKRPTEEEIRKEKNFRRADPDFAYAHGGPILKDFLNKTDALGLVNEQTRIMCQISPIVQGTYPSPPNWHVDRMPGTIFNLHEHISHPIQGAILCVCSEENTETTEFISYGRIHLVEPGNTDAVHIAGQYMKDSEGLMNWPTFQIEEQIKAGELKMGRIDRNTIYRYDSTYFHKAPMFQKNGGYRIILRLNTPPVDFPYAVVTQNEVLPEQPYYFRVSKDGTKWEKYVVED